MCRKLTWGRMCGLKIQRWCVHASICPVRVTSVQTGHLSPMDNRRWATFGTCSLLPLAMCHRTVLWLSQSWNCLSKGVNTPYLSLKMEAGRHCTCIINRLRFFMRYIALCYDVSGFTLYILGTFYFLVEKSDCLFVVGDGLILLSRISHKLCLML